MSSSRDDETARRVRFALRRAAEALPELAGLAHRVVPVVSNDVKRAGVYRSGKLTVHADWFLALNDDDATYVVAHELMHLLLRTHERSEGSDSKLFNVMHDAVINDTLTHALGRPAPQGGVAIAGARHRSAEELVLKWRGHAEPLQCDEDVLQDDPSGEERPGDEVERDPTSCSWRNFSWRNFPVRVLPDPISPAQAEALAKRIRFHRNDVVARAAPPSEAPAWDLVGHEDAVRAVRTFARASRRPAADVVRPGHRHTPGKLNVVLDTSTSMAGTFPRALGAVWSFCATHGIEEVRLVQCDNRVLSDASLEPEQLRVQHIVSSGDRDLLVMEEVCEACGVHHAYRVQGDRLTDLAPALELLASDPDAQSVVVLTDGFVSAKPVSLHVLWAVTHANEQFQPGFGEIVSLSD